MKRGGYFILAVFMLAMMAGCKKNKKIDLRPDLNVANDQLLANRPFIYMFRMLVMSVSDSSLQATHQSMIDGALVSLDDKKQKYTFIFQGNQSADSTWRTGTCTATVDSGFFNNGTHIRFVFQQYAEDGHYVTGTDSIVCNGSLNGEYQYDEFIREAKITKDSARNIRFGAAYQIGVNIGVKAQGMAQTVILIGGTSQGISSGGYSFTSDITASLKIYESCPWIKEGLITFSIPGVDVTSGTIEFMAKDSCNDKIRYDFNGSIYLMRIKENYLRN